MPNFQSRLMVHRFTHHLSQEQLAKELGVSRQTINAIETERRAPSLFLALKIAKYFHTSVEEIFSFTDHQR